jgi:cytidylate kinase
LLLVVAERLPCSEGELTVTVKDITNIDLTGLDRSVLAAHAIGEAASKIAVMPEVRRALVEAQRAFSRKQPGTVLDGRDIGTVVCPDAEVKLFIEADSKSRMERRARQFEARGRVVDRYALYHQIEERDARDSANPNGGFYPAADAHLLDTTLLDIEAALRAAVAIVDGVMAGKAAPQGT